MDMETITEIFAVIGVVVVVATPIAAGLERGAQAFLDYTLTTATKKDDEAAETAVKWAARISSGLEWVSGVLPVVSLRGGGRK